MGPGADLDVSGRDESLGPVVIRTPAHILRGYKTVIFSTQI